MLQIPLSPFLLPPLLASPLASLPPSLQRTRDILEIRHKALVLGQGEGAGLDVGARKEGEEG